MAKAKILIIDDDRDIRLGLHFQLRSHGYDTMIVEDAMSAVATARKEKPEVILLDLGLPAGDGFVVLERLEKIRDMASIPVIVITARAAEEYEARAREAGAFAFFQKPVEKVELLSAIEDALLGHPRF